MVIGMFFLLAAEDEPLARGAHQDAACLFSTRGIVDIPANNALTSPAGTGLLK